MPASRFAAVRLIHLRTGEQLLMSEFLSGDVPAFCPFQLCKIQLLKLACLPNAEQPHGRLVGRFIDVQSPLLRWNQVWATHHTETRMAS